MASLRFHKVKSLPASYTVGDVYYVEGQGIYVATSTSSCTRFSYANDAGTNIKGVVSKSDIASVKVNNAAAADSATNYASTGTIASKFSTVDSSIDTINGKIDKINASVSDKTLTITKPDGSTVTFTDTDSHYSHGHTFKANAATSTSGVATSVDVVSALNAASATTGNLSSTYDMVKVPTLAVTNGLANRISSLESTATTGMQYKGTTATVPTSGKVGDVWKCSSVISSLGAEAGDFIVCSKTGSGTSATWDVWQANVNKDAYWDTNTPVSGNFVYAADATGKLMDSGKNANSFADKTHYHASSTINAMTNYTKGTSSAAIATTDTLNAAIGKLEYKADTTQTSLSDHTSNKSNPHGVTASQVGLGNVTNNRQVVGLSNGTTAGHFVTWGANGYTVADSGCTADSFDAKGTASDLITTLRGGYNDTLQSVANAAAAAQSTANSKWTHKTATQANGGSAVEGTVKGYYADTAGFSVSPIINGVVYYKDTNTHYTNTFTITNGTTAAQTFAQDANKSLAIKAAATGSLTASTSATLGTLTVNVGVDSNHVIPSNSQITAWNNKYDSTSFNKDNFDTSGAVSLVWATWATS